MTIASRPFGDLRGRLIEEYTLTNRNGLAARMITFGARLTGMDVPDRKGNIADITLGFDTLEQYVATDHYFGATCGRYGNRIAAGLFSLDGKNYRVSLNEGPHHLHGGERGFDKLVWNAQPVESENAVVFTMVSPAGDQGFPGELLLAAKYTLTDDNRLLIAMSGTASATTVLNMVNHAYWNVAGQASGSLNDQMLEVAADFYTPVDSALLATGEIVKVEGTPFDFRKAKPIGKDMDALGTVTVGHLIGGGYDHNWVLREHAPGLRTVATLIDPASGRGFMLRSTEPGVQIYTGGYMNETMVGKGGKPYRAYQGLTFETQKFPGSPNFAHFPTTRLEPGEVYRHHMDYQFFAK